MKKKQESIIAYKGFDENMCCRGYQFEVGKTYKEDEAKLCKSGFHACEHPLDTFGYYPPSTSRYAAVDLSDVTSETSNDTKRVAKEIHIKSEIGIKGIIEAAIKFVFDCVDFTNAEAQASGDQGAAQASGDRGAAIAEHPKSIAIAAGIESRAKGVLGSWIVLSEWVCVDDEWDRKNVKAIQIDGETIKAETFYMLKNNEIVEANL